MLFQLGALTIDVAHFNADRTKHSYGGDFAVKPIVGAQQPREFMGPSDEKMVLSGVLFPLHPNFGGLGGLAALQAMAASGEPQILVRNDGANLGWWFIERAEEDANLAGRRSAVGATIHYQIELVASPDPASPDAIISTMIQLFGG